ncbi:MAG TPA: YqgE/AlgH family protein, partial [Gaiellaceae bacterium]|nr:YqgE/AlgH family protein [Gaiellaceae bacterium]
MDAERELVAPIMLLAMPQVADPFFRKSVVLLLAHEKEGSFGFIVNRATELRIVDILRDLELEWGGDAAELARFGGPVQPQVGTVLFAAGGPPPELEDSTEIVPGVRLTQNRSAFAKLASAPPPRLRLLLGYAGWGEGQLVGEIVRNDWLTAPVDVELIFGGGTEETWERALRSVGIDPAALPAWTESELD